MLVLHVSKLVFLPEDVSSILPQLTPVWLPISITHKKKTGKILKGGQ